MFIFNFETWKQSVNPVEIVYYISLVYVHIIEDTYTEYTKKLDFDQI